MSQLSRRQLVAASAGAAAAGFLPRLGLAQADNRPSITVAVQKISNSNALEVLREQSNVGERVFDNIFEGLIMRDLSRNMEMIPGLATEWRRIDDRTVEPPLRQGVKFHNGDEMTADDVAFSYGPERMFGSGAAPQISRVLFTLASQGGDSKELPPEVRAVAKRNWPALERIEVIDRYTVRFVNAKPDVTMEGRISRYGSEIVSRRAFLEAKSWLDWAQRPISTGPYLVREFKPDTYLILEAHDEYWGGRPPVKTLRFVEVPEIPSRINGLLSGEYLFACDIPPDQIVGIERNPRFQVQGGLILNHRLTVFDKNHPQLLDPRIRQALTHAIDRQAIVDSLWAGRTAVPKGLQWPYYAEMFHADWSVPAYDPKRAQELVKAAGYKGDPIPYRLLNNYYINQVATAQILAEMWKAVGLNVEIQMKENWQQIFVKDAPRAIRDWSNSAPFNDPVSSIVNQHGPNGQQQQVGEWTNAEFNMLSDELETSTDRARRKVAFRRMLEIAEREDPAFTVLHQNATFNATRKDLAWKCPPSFALNLRPGNFRMGAA